MQASGTSSSSGNGHVMQDILDSNSSYRSTEIVIPNEKLLRPVLSNFNKSCSITGDNMLRPPLYQHRCASKNGISEASHRTETQVSEIVKNKLALIMNSKSSKLKPNFDTKVQNTNRTVPRSLTSEVCIPHINGVRYKVASVSSSLFNRTSDTDSTKIEQNCVKSVNDMISPKSEHLISFQNCRTVSSNQDTFNSRAEDGKDCACRSVNKICMCSVDSFSQNLILESTLLSSDSEDKLILNRKHVKLKDENDSNKKPVNNRCSAEYQCIVNLTDIVVQPPDNPNKQLSTDSIHSSQNHKADCNGFNHIDHTKDDVENLCFVFQSSQRIAFFPHQTKFTLSKHNFPQSDYYIAKIQSQLLSTHESSIKVVVEKENKRNGYHPKKMRSSPREHFTKSTSSEESSDECSDNAFKCKWFDCQKLFPTVEKFTKHVKKDHVQPSIKNDVFVCLWRNCRFSNQPSCSYKWLLKHVLRHCDLKPFKCVIHGCDMAFVTQNGLARHVPTHFNEGNVRRACVKTYTSEASLLWESPKIRRNLASKLSVVSDSCENSRDSFREDSLSGSRLERFVCQKKSKYLSDSFTSRNYNQLKRKLQQSTCSPVLNHGYVGKLLRIDHKVVGRRTLQNGECNMLVAPTLSNLFSHRPIWFDATSFRQHQLMHIDVPVSNLPEDTKNVLYDSEHASRRRTPKRK